MSMQHQGSAPGSVLVVGGGIAGFAMMRALDQQGIPALLVDRLKGPPDFGLGLNLPGNAVRALRNLGVGDELRSRGVPVRRREYRNARGRLMFAVDEAGFWGSEAGSICALRGDVWQLLSSGISASAVRWATPVTAVSEPGPEIEVSFGNAAAESYDFVIGADGVHSAVRTSIFGLDAPRAALLSAASWRFVTTNPGVDCWSVWSGPAGTFLMIPVDA
jgi:2-polyprenyl-6-methoxyphenol hydroxylase-like FAD-dependent oxidoreductase